MTTLTNQPAHDAVDGRVHSAACHVYDAECAMHVAHQSHVDAWIEAASDSLHNAIGNYLAALAEYEPTAIRSSDSAAGREPSDQG